MRVIDSNKVATGLLVLMGTQVAGVLLSWVYGPLLSLSERMEFVFAGIWLVFAVVMCAGLALVALGTEPPVLAWVALVLELVTTVASQFVQHGVQLLGLTHASVSFLSAPLMLLSMAERGLVLWLFVSLLRGKHTWGPMVAVGAFAIGMVRSALPFALSFGALDIGFFTSPLYRVALAGVSLLTAGGSLALAWFARQTVLAGDEAAVPAREAALGVPTVEQPYSPAADLAIGAVLLVIGIGVTAVSMSAASGGGRYVVATGAIGVGLARIIRGLVKSARS